MSCERFVNDWFMTGTMTIAVRFNDVMMKDSVSTFSNTIDEVRGHLVPIV